MYGPFIWEPVANYRPDKVDRRAYTVVVWVDDHKRADVPKGPWEHLIGNPHLAYSHFMLIPRPN